jgi:two-component system response regulator HydG
MLLISTDSTLVASVGEAVESINGLDLKVVDDVDRAGLMIGSGKILVVVYHLNEDRSVTGVTRLLQTIALERPGVSMLVVSETHRPTQALALLRLGVADCLPRPLDLNHFTCLVELLLISGLQEAQRAESPAIEVMSTAQVPIIARNVGAGADAEHDRIMEQMRRISPLDTTVLLEGETGTGKTRLARNIHELSSRREKPFLAINCGALSASLIESEMFGHVRGAFTGADTDRNGKFADAGRGTLFLDEIDSLPMVVQSKLLRAVEERVFEPVGSNRSLTLQARLIVASNRPLGQEVAAGRFRSDLYYRLNVVSLMLLPLRQRTGVIPALARDFLNEFAARSGCQIEGIAPDALDCLLAHSWPGNIRELRNVIERAVALCQDSIIRLGDLPVALHRLAPESSAPPAGAANEVRMAPSAPSGSTSLARSKAQAEWGVITAALQRHGGNRLRAASDLGISRKTLYQKLNKFALMGLV